jgi:Matrixin
LEIQTIKLLQLIVARNKMKIANCVFGMVALMLVGLPSSALWAQTSSLPPQPWPNTNPLTVSFAPDFVEVGRYRNELTQHFNGQLSTPDWKIEILRAFQEWSRHTNLQTAIVPDSPRAFGVPGLSQNDPRFGDIRIGAFPQENVLGNAVPFNTAAGSWAGDIFFDTSRQFYIRDGGQGNEPPDAYDLYSVALHEIGNSLGLEDVFDDPDSVMFFSYFGARTGLSNADIAELQALYGPPKADSLEPASGNDSFASATRIAYPANFAQTLIASKLGRIQHADDVDFYRFNPNARSSNCWVKLRARGRSLLCGSITMYDSNFNELATIAAENPLANTVIKEITGLVVGQPVYVKVEWSGVNGFEFGDYELALDFNANGGEEGEEGDDEEELARFFEADDEAFVDLLFSLNGLVDEETTTNNSFNNAVRLYSAFGAPEGSRFEMLSAIASSTDFDTYRIVTSPTATGTMAIDLTPLGIDPALLDARVFNSNRTSVSARRRIRSTGDVVLDVSNIAPNTTYYVRVQNRSGNSIASNYLLLVNVADRSAQLERIEQVNLNASQPDKFGSFTTYKTQLFRFDLTMSAPGTTNQASQLTIYSDTGRVELVTSVRPGQRRVAFVWLQAGEHYVRFTARTLNGASIVASTVNLDGASVSDDEGPVLIDPSGNPISGPQRPGSNPSPPPQWGFPITFVWLNDFVLPPEKP